MNRDQFAVRKAKRIRSPSPTLRTVGACSPTPSAIANITQLQPRNLSDDTLSDSVAALSMAGTPPQTPSTATPPSPPPVLIVVSANFNDPRMNLPAAEAGGHAVAAAFGAGAADVKVNIRAEDLDAHLTGRRILFYEGHGDNALRGEHVLAFRGPHGELESIHNDDFVRIVKKHAQHGLCEVVLNGCRTHGLASRLRDEAGVAVVVCWATKAHDTAAAKFAETYAERMRAAASQPA